MEEGMTQEPAERGYTCARCGRYHGDLPYAYGLDAPDPWRPEYARDSRNRLGEEQCEIVTLGSQFIRGIIVIPVKENDETFEWGGWCAVDLASDNRASDIWDDPGRDKEPPFSGQLASELGIYIEPTFALELTVRTRALGLRPSFLLEDARHPLVVAQREGISRDRVVEIATLIMHDGV